MADQRDVALAQLADQPQQLLDALSAESVDCPDDEHGELAAVRIVEHPRERLAVLALVRGGVRDLIAPCDLPAAVLAEALEVRGSGCPRAGDRWTLGPRSPPSCSQIGL